MDASCSVDPPINYTHTYYTQRTLEIGEQRFVVLSYFDAVECSR